MTATTKYKTCPKCKVRHSALVPHKCFMPEEQEDKPKFDPTEEGEGGNGGGGDGSGDAEGQNGDDDAEGEGQGEGQGEGEGDGEKPQPKPPEPDAPVAVIICTVLKFAALTAACSKNGVIEVTLSEEGLMVYGHNGEQFAFETIPWGEFEKRATLDGEFFVKEIIDGVDDQLIEAKATVIESKPIKTKSEKKAKAEKPTLTVPMFVGQRVVCRDGTVREVKRIDTSAAYYTTGQCVFARNESGYKIDTAGRGNADPMVDRPYDALHDAPAEEAKPKKKGKAKLTLPLTLGQKVVAKNGSVGKVITVEDDNNAEVRFTEGKESGERWWYLENGRWSGQQHDPRYERHLVSDAA